MVTAKDLFYTGVSKQLRKQGSAVLTARIGMITQYQNWLLISDVLL
jgi:hypothetical protein